MEWKNIAVKPDTSIRKVIDIIDKSSAQIALVINEKEQLIGTITDGDIRRGILRGVDLDDQAKKIYNQRPITADEHVNLHTLINIMKTKFIRQLPILDESGRIIKIALLKDIIHQKQRDNWVVIMAGGQGKRLKPLTDECPKPLLKINDSPLLEIILKNLEKQGFKDIYISINYMGEMITEYFGDGSSLGLKIQYLKESHKMGTAGSLSLLKNKPSDPIVVMNGDLLTTVDFSHMIDFHERHHCLATMGVIEYGFEVPYGVVQLESHNLLGLDEKPKHKFFINAGIYVLEPSVIEKIPQNKQFDMTQLFQKLIEEQKELSAFPIREYWLDIGRPEDFDRASSEFIQC